MSVRKIIEAKLNETVKHNDGEFFGEDTSLYIAALAVPHLTLKFPRRILGEQAVV